MRTRYASRYIPQGAEEIAHPEGLGTVYAYAQNGRLLAVAYCGKASKPAWHYRFTDEERRQGKIKEFFAQLDAHKAYVCQRRADRNQPHSLKIGDVIVNSWGYEQTNVDFYKVVATTRNFVDLVRIGATAVPGSQGFMSEKLVADPSVVLKNGKVTRHKAEKDSVHFKHGSGSKDTPGQSHYCSWYY